MTALTSSDILFVTGSGLRTGFSDLVANGSQTLVITSRGVPNAIIRPFVGDEEERFLNDMSLLTVPLRDVVKQFRKIRHQIEIQGHGQAAISRVPPFQSAEELLKIITLIPRSEAARLNQHLRLDPAEIAELSQFRPKSA